MNNELLSKYDEWLTDGSAFAALVMREWLTPIEGSDATIFPPTYSLKKTEAARRFKAGQNLPGFYENSKGDAYGYNMDRLNDGTTVCQIDSVGAQANRMEPIFKRADYEKLVPQVPIQVGQETKNLLDAGHRAADALIRFTDLLQPILDAAFRALKNGDAEPMAKIAPTSIVFGAWDSRSTQVKLPRIIRSVIRAYKVEPLHRSAQYIPPVDYVDGGILAAPEGEQQRDAMSELGLNHAPATWSHGGIIVQGEIRRDAALNLVALRALRVARRKNEDDKTFAERQLNLRRYVLGLALVCFTAPAESFLREGCQLVPDTKKAAEWKLVKHDGTRCDKPITSGEALLFATSAADVFVVGTPPAGKAVFNSDAAREVLGQSGSERKAARRQSRKAATPQSNAQPKQTSDAQPEAQ